jgi:hypothetical protein
LAGLLLEGAQFNTQILDHFHFLADALLQSLHLGPQHRILHGSQVLLNRGNSAVEVHSSCVIFSQQCIFS